MIFGRATMTERRPLSHEEEALQAERFGMVLALLPVLNGLRALTAPDRSDDDGDEPAHLIEATEVRAWQRRLEARLEMIAQGLHRIDETPPGERAAYLDNKIAGPPAETCVSVWEV